MELIKVFLPFSLKLIICATNWTYGLRHSQSFWASIKPNCECEVPSGPVLLYTSMRPVILECLRFPFLLPKQKPSLKMLRRKKESLSAMLNLQWVLYHDLIVVLISPLQKPPLRRAATASICHSDVTMDFTNFTRCLTLQVSMLLTV